MLNKFNIHPKQIKRLLIIVSFLFLCISIGNESMHIRSSVELTILIFSGFFCALGCTILYYGVSRE
jgi:hypothetical protein